MMYNDFQANDLAHSRVRELETQADRARILHETPSQRSFADLLGDLFLKWGRGLREKSGKVHVEIELEPIDECRGCAA